MLKRFSPGMEKFATTNGAWATGDGIVFAEKLGAGLVDIDKVQLHPTGFINPKDRKAKQRFLAPEALRGSGGILLNIEGKRFVNELDTRDKVSEAILKQTEGRAFLILFEQGAKELKSALEFYSKVGIVKYVHNIDEIATYFNLDKEALKQELNKYATAATAGRDEFGKVTFPFPLQPVGDENLLEAVIMEIEPVVHYCMGT